MVRISAQVDGQWRDVSLLWLVDESRMPGEGVLAGAVDREWFLGEPGGILRELGTFSEFGEPPEALTERVAREAVASHVVLGDSPETWSPLGSTRLESGRFTSASIPDDTERSDELWFDVDDHEGWLWTRLRDLESGRSAVTVRSPDAFVAVLPPGVSEVVLDLTEDVDLDGAFLRDALDTATIRGWEGPHDVEVGIDWRTYAGSGTAVTDGDETADPSDPRVRIRMSRLGRAGYLVGRLFGRSSATTFTGSRDPSRGARLALHGRAQPQVVVEAPELDDADPARRAIVVVHGTMGCAIPLAGTVLAAVRGAGVAAPVLRFEHDTWLPIWESVEALVAGVGRLGATSVLLVGHSRGGLVARDAGILLADDGVAVETLTLGAPFDGTPLIGVAERGRRGLAAGLAALRASAGPVVDGLTRAVLRELRHQLPEGIRDMHPRSSCLGRLRATPGPSFVAAAGAVAPDGEGDDSWGVSPSFFHGLFDGENDRVVAASSASAARGAISLPVRCDHSSYLHERAVRDQIAALAARV
ncbi:hypothetical protein GCM10009718_19270 [Isoptericola halotolerans]|uniref:Alpha/beta hydrolase family protein n=1 Tax=Isoptericola halotolerans TaxID=300560 RepID=A0ABX2A6J6_9MICO|nr:hypothetical protein [Isoptericola halotolerans]NOV98489.1 hypothetical protein [Isoptericola halotolerans]